MELREKTLEQSYIYKGKVINLRLDKNELPNGKTGMREIVEHSGGVCVAALTKKDELIFVRQYRSPYEEIVTELPAGKIDKGEDPLTCGKRELLEETGATAGRYIDLGRFYPTPGYCGETIYLYGALDLEFSEQAPDEDEFLEVVRLPLQEAVQMVLENKLPDGKTQTAVMKLNVLKQNNFEGALFL
ncbi:MAG TPA: NUDIX hydrolase [Clostridiales bacterium]|jgi:ADP-ribose pyrophosphatase|nr:NUDIX hydrolase [Clostridiales bacterium]HRT82238.1 NUDIX hydrolase [Oscillospiraceae bacterium]